MMRYQRLSPNCIPLSNGKKPTLTPCKDDDDDDGESSGRIPSYIPSFKRPFSYSAAVDLSGGVCSGAGDGLLQWGHRKRSRVSRAESRPLGDESSTHSRRAIKIQRRAAAIAAMPPPGGPYTRGSSLRPCTPVLDAAAHVSRTVDERSGGQHRSERRSPAPSPYKSAGSLANGCTSETALSSDLTKPAAEPEPAGTPSGLSAAEKLSLSPLEWPRIYVSLSRKEKEDDFLAMKGTKLPQRPKKRPKNIDKTLQYCFPGMWLSDLTRGRYEVREKKCVKKKRRGLKWMESMESDSE